MKLSDKILLGLGVGVVLVVFLMLLAVRYWVTTERELSEVVARNAQREGVTVHTR